MCPQMRRRSIHKGQSWCWHAEAVRWQRSESGRAGVMCHIIFGIWPSSSTPYPLLSLLHLLAFIKSLSFPFPHIFQSFLLHFVDFFSISLIALCINFFSPLTFSFSFLSFGLHHFFLPLVLCFPSTCHL